MAPNMPYKNKVAHLLTGTFSFKVAIILSLIVYNFLLNKVTIITRTMQKNGRVIRFDML